MVTIGMNYEVISGKEELFERSFQAVLDAMRDNQEHRASYLYQKVKDSGSYLILSEWESEAGFSNFVKSDAFRRVTTWGKEEVLRARPSHKVYNG
jgi:heme-degrading monooxygenase HmoA